MAPRPLSFADFGPRRGERFGVETPDGTVELVLAEARPLSGATREAGGFRLEFHGPLAPALDQGTYRFEVGGEPHDIFIVPIARTAEAMSYEAIFL